MNTQESIAWSWCVLRSDLTTEFVLTGWKLIGVTRGLEYLHGNGIVHGSLKDVVGAVLFLNPSSQLTRPTPQRNILIDETGTPRIHGFGGTCYTVRYCAPERLGSDLWNNATYKSDVYSLSMVIVEVRLFLRLYFRQGWKNFLLQLATGKMPLPGLFDSQVLVLLSKGKRPQKPHPFKAPGFTPDVWRIAGMCWHEKPKKRPTAHAVLRYLEDIATGGEYVRTTAGNPCVTHLKKTYSEYREGDFTIGTTFPLAPTTF